MRVLRRRSAVVALVVALGLLLGVSYVSSSDDLYEASAKVLLSRGSPAATLTGVTGVAERGDPERFVQTQAEIGRTEALAHAVLAAEGLRDRTVFDLLAAREVIVGGSADVLEFRVRDPSESVAVRLAGQFAAQFTKYQRSLDKTALDQARREIRVRLDELRRQGAAGTGTAVYRDLVEQDRKLQAAEPLDTGKALVLSTPAEATQIRPRPRTDLAIALAASLLLGVLAAFLLEALDRRLDSPSAISRRLRLPFVGHIPSMPGLRSTEHMTLVAGPEGRQAEVFQLLRRNLEASLDAAGVDAPGGVVMFTSPRRRDGKSTTVANLALALTLAGRQVVLVELDGTLRAQRVFDVPAAAGLAEISEGVTTLDEALVPVDVDGEALTLLPLGRSAGSLGKVLAHDLLPQVLEQLRARADLVLIDAPPLLAADGALQIAAHADALVLVVRLKGVRDRMLVRVASLLGGRAPVKLGVIGTGASPAAPWEAADDAYPPSHPVPALSVADAEERGHRGTRGRSQRRRA